MTVSVTHSTEDFTAAGGVADFPFTFRCDDVAWLQVLLDGATQAGAAYGVVLNPDQDAMSGGTVTFVASPAAGVAVSIRRVLPLEQRVDLRPLEPFRAASIEQGMDELAMQIQQIDARLTDEMLSRAADVQASVAAEAAARAAADQAIIDSGLEPLSVGLAPALATGGTEVKVISDWLAQFQAAGETGSTNPMAFGGVGDGATDDAAAVQACVEHCLSFTPPKAMIVTHKHYIASSVNIDRAVNTIADITKFRVIGYGDHAGFHTTVDINFFSSTIAPAGAQAMSQGVVFDRIAFTTDSISRTVYVLAERFIRVAFVGCTFNLVGCYAYATCFAQDMLWDRCTISAGSTVFAASQGSYACTFINCNAFGDARPGLFYSGGAGHGTQGFRFIANLVEGLGGYVASLSGCYGCLIEGNHFESMQTANAFHLYGAARNANISFVGNFVVLYAGPFVYCGPTDSIFSAGNYLTITGDTLAGNRYMYGSADFVTDLVHVGDHCTAGMGAAISDATLPSMLNGVTRSGTGRATGTGQFGFGIVAQAASRATFAGEDASATKYAATYLDSGGNVIATFRNDKRIAFPGLPNYATNAAALAGGLVAGELYRNAGVVQVVT